MNKEDERNLSLTHNHYQYMAQKIISNIGGKENIVDFENCMTRLRLELNDSSLVNEERIKQTGAHGIIIIDKHHAQIVIGPEVNKVAKSLSKEIES